jgi:hypothetical protein
VWKKVQPEGETKLENAVFNAKVPKIRKADHRNTLI